MRRMKSVAAEGSKTRRVGTVVLRAYPKPQGPAPSSAILTNEVFAETLNARTENRRRFGRFLSMDIIESALRAAYRGSMRQITDVLRETVETDPHLGAILNKRFGAVASLPFEVQPASGFGIDRAKAMFYAEVCRQQLRNMKSFRDNLNQMAWALFDGRACLEMQWVHFAPGVGVSSDQFGSTFIAVKEMDWIHPRRLSFGPQREIRIQPETVTTGGTFSSTGISVNDPDFADKFIWWTPKQFGEYPEREGLGIRNMYWSFFKRFAARERMILVELYGKPWRIVTVDEESTAGADELEAADRIVDALGSTYTARLPRGTKLEVIAPTKNAGQVHAEIIKESDQQNSKLVLGNTGTTDGVPAGLNSNQANVMQDEQLGVLIRDATWLSEVIETFLTDRIIAVNFGESETTHAPTFRLRADLPADRTAELGRLQAALNAGLPVARDEAYEVSGFSVPDVEEPVIRMVQPPTPPNSPVAPAVRPEVVYPSGLAPEPGEIEVTPPSAGEAAPNTASNAGVVAGTSTIKVNEDRAARGLEPLTMEDGTTPDPRGNLSIKEFNALIDAQNAPEPAPAPVETSEMAPLGLSRVALNGLENVADEIDEGEELYGEAGIHAHVVHRNLEMTAPDGAHSHVFLLPSGEFVMTAIDGMHQHQLPNVDADETDNDGEHQHLIDLGGVVVGTGAGISAHTHLLQVRATAVDGAHRHTLEIADPDNPGASMEIRSLTAGEFVAALREQSLPPAIASSMDKKRKSRTVYGQTEGADILAKIKKLPNGKYRVTKEDGTGNLGEFDTREQAAKRLGEIEGFKDRASARALVERGIEHSLAVQLENASWHEWIEDTHDHDHVQLELDQDQPRTANGSTEDYVVKGMRELTNQTSAWATKFEEAVDGELTASSIFGKLTRARAAMSVDKFGRALERRKLQSLMLGVLDAARETIGDDPEAGADTIEDVVEQSEELATGVETLEEGVSDELTQVLGSMRVALQGVEDEFTKMPFAQAVKFFKNLNILDRPSFERAVAAIKRRSFTVAGVMSDQMLRVIQAELTESILAGDDLRLFKKRIRPRLKQAGFIGELGTLRTGARALNASHVETVFRTNVLNTYNTGRFAYQSSPAVVAAFPVWEIRALVPTSSKDRQTHFAANGKKLLANDPFWASAYPPFGFNCRCRVVARPRSALSSIVAGSSILGLPDRGFVSGHPALALG